MAVYNIIYGNTADCSAEGFGSTYSTARLNTASSSLAPNATLNIRNTFSSPTYTIRQVFLQFDLSSIPSGSGTGRLSLNGLTSGSATGTIEIAEVSSLSNKISGASLPTPIGSCVNPTTDGRFGPSIADISTLTRSATFKLICFFQSERLNVAPTTNDPSVVIDAADQTGTTSDPYLVIYFGSPWEFVGVSNEVAVATTAHALVTTGISGTLAAGDLLVACITSRIASTTSVTLPTGGEWTLVSEQKNNNTATNTTAAASGLMAYCVRGASNPNLTFTHPVAPSQAQGRIVAYRNVNTSSPKDTQTSFTTTSVTAVSGTGLTTTQIEDLIVAMACGGQEATWSAFNATDPAGASGATVTTAPTTTWSERADSAVTTGADGSLAIFDAVKLTSGATGNLTATASLQALHVVIAGAFKIAAAATTGTGTPTGQAGAASGAGISSSDGTGTPAGQAATASGVGTAGDAAVTGMGAAAAGAAVVSGVGISASTGTGALAAQVATTAGVGASASSGTGSLTGQAATVAGVGVAASSGAGALVEQNSTASGAGTVASTGTGTLDAQAATVAGTGLSVAAAIGALEGAAATVAGAGVSASTGTGSVVAGSAEVAGAGTAAAANSGALVAQAATVEGLGVSASIGSGALQAGAATIAGAGLVASTGTGALVAGAVAVAGDGTVIEEGVAVGVGALVAGAATISGAGDVTGEVAPPVSVGGGGIYRPTQPFPVEGVGYAILPQLEGEAVGLVVAAGVGIGALPTLVGTSDGTVDGVGRSAARLAIKAAATGERGQAGAAIAVLKGFTVLSAGAAGVRGSGSAVITLKGVAIGQHDDDEAAIMAILLAA